MGKKILVIDDTEEIASLVAARLEAQNYEVSIATDGADGLDKAQKILPDLILLDIRMPKVDGWTFVHNIRQVTSIKKIPIIVTSSHDQMKDLFNIEGVSDFLKKPTDASLLLETVRKHLKD